jgi:hypothetical protein
VANNRLYYAVYQAGLAECGTNTFTAIHGLQSLGLNTTFALDPYFEIGQVSLYENKENLPSCEAQLEKLLDGYALMYHLATPEAVTASLSGRSAARCTLGVSFFSDVQDSASGTPLSQCTVSGMYVSSLGYTFPVNGAFTESLTLAGNNKIWTNTFSSTTFNNADEPLAIAGSGGVNVRQDLIMGEPTGVVSKFPADIYGISSSGYNPYSTTLQSYGAHLQNVRVSASLGRDDLLELGKRGPYHRFAQFPVEVRTEFEVLDQSGDRVAAIEDSTSNLTNRTIYLVVREGTKIDLGTRNKLASANWGGANAGQQGGNATSTYVYTNFNDFKVTHPQDPAALS